MRYAVGGAVVLAAVTLLVARRIRSRAYADGYIDATKRRLSP